MLDYLLGNTPKTTVTLNLSRFFRRLKNSIMSHYNFFKKKGENIQFTKLVKVPSFKKGVKNIQFTKLVKIPSFKKKGEIFGLSKPGICHFLLERPKRKLAKRKGRRSIGAGLSTQSPWGLSDCMINFHYLARLLQLEIFPLQRETLTTVCGKTILVYPRRSDIVSELPFVSDNYRTKLVVCFN